MSLTNSLKFNAVAPGFKLNDENGGPFSLTSQFARNSNVVLFFCPRPLGVGDIMEFHYFKEVFESFSQLDAVVVAVAPSSSDANKRFKEKFQLPFSILSDTSGSIRRMYGFKYFFIPTRLTVVIDKQQKMVHQYESFISSKNHSKKALKILEDISNYKYAPALNRG